MSQVECISCHIQWVWCHELCGSDVMGTVLRCHKDWLWCQIEFIRCQTVVGLISHMLQMCYNQYTVSNSTATVDAMTGMLGVMTLIQCVWMSQCGVISKRVYVMSYVFIWCHAYFTCVIIHTMRVIWSVIWVWWQRYSGRAAKYNQFDMRYNKLM